MMMQKLGVAVCLWATLPLLWAQSGTAAKPESPDAISGMYTFLQEGEFVQVSVDPDGRVSGFVSRYADPHEKSGFLDHFFDKAALNNGQLSFTTKTVHGVWYDFKGVVGRGEGKTRAQEGYYLIRGTLTEYTSDANKKVTARTREVTFRSFPQDVESDEQPSK